MYASNNNAAIPKPGKMRGESGIYIYFSVMKV